MHLILIYMLKERTILEARLNKELIEANDKNFQLSTKVCNIILSLSMQFASTHVDLEFTQVGMKLCGIYLLIYLI